MLNTFARTSASGFHPSCAVAWGQKWRLARKPDAAQDHTALTAHSQYANVADCAKPDASHLLEPDIFVSLPFPLAANSVLLPHLYASVVGAFVVTDETLLLNPNSEGSSVSLHSI